MNARQKARVALRVELADELYRALVGRFTVPPLRTRGLGLDIDDAYAISLGLLAHQTGRREEALMREQSAVLARMSEETGHFVRQLKSAEFKEAFTAFSERRAPDFSKFG